MGAIKRGEKYYIEVEVDVEHQSDSVWVSHPYHPENEYSEICVYKKDLISKSEIEKEKDEAYHRGHKNGFDAGFSAFMF